jgi:hypothetical protein
MNRRVTAALVLAGAILALLPALVLAAGPSPSAAAAGDTRSPGQGPGLVGAPLLAILVVLGIGIGTALVTLAYVRFSKPGNPRDEPG